MNTKEEILKEFVQTLAEKWQKEPANYLRYSTSFKSYLSKTLDRYALAVVEKTIGEHNARILNEFQLQGKPHMPFIAYDERVCLAPAIEIATKETLEALRIVGGGENEEKG